MAHKSKRFIKLLSETDTKKVYNPQEAFDLLKKQANTKFVQSVDVAVKLNLDTTKPEQQLRGTFTLPHTIAKPIRILVIDDTFTKAQAAETKVDFYGSLEKIDEIKQGWLDFDLIITTPKMMPNLSKLGKLLGPKGLMPNPKLGTVTNDVAKAVLEFKMGKNEYRTDTFGNIHMQIGKVDFSTDKLLENLDAVLKLLLSKKPSVVKGTYMQNVVVSTTMGLGLKVAF